MKLILLKSAQKELDDLENSIALRISSKILALKDNPYNQDGKKLIGNKGYRVRIGNYRVIYVIDKENKTIYIVKISHRREVYR